MGSAWHNDLDHRLVFSFIEYNVAATDAKKYLEKYGYLEKNQDYQSTVSSKAFSNAIKKFQDFANLETTGVMDSQTANMMNSPRCGVADNPAKFGQLQVQNSGASNTGMTSSNYVLHGNKWEKKELTYRINSYPSSTLSKSVVDSNIRKAFDMWQQVSGLSFSESSADSADIQILFAKGEHGDGNPFDGPGGTLAHAYFPSQGHAISGDAHFDDDEKWSVTPNVGVQIINTLTHEFGHSIGLRHSRVRGAMMFPWYTPTTLSLSNDDIQGVQALYGSSVTNSAGTNRPSNNPPTPSIVPVTKVAKTTKPPFVIKRVPKVPTTWGPWTTCTSVNSFPIQPRKGIGRCRTRTSVPMNRGMSPRVFPQSRITFPGMSGNVPRFG